MDAPIALSDNAGMTTFVQCEDPERCIVLEYAARPENSGQASLIEMSKRDV